MKLNPKKLLHSKWTAVAPQRKEKHFLVTKLILPDPPNTPIEFVEIEAVFSNRTQIIPWVALTNAEEWRQGWIRD